MRNAIRRLFACLPLCWYSAFLIAQPSIEDLNITLPQSPNAASLGKYGDIPVSMATGTPSVSVPMPTLRGRSLTLDLSLSYHASGIKVDDVPSWVGLGWSLNAGGVITRTVHGIADDELDGWLNTADDLYDFLEDCSDTTAAGCSSYVESVKSAQKDPQPDEFFFNFAGMSGKFVFDELGNPMTIPANRMKIEFTTGVYNGNYNSAPNVSTLDCINSFKITTIDGTQYYFEKKELTHDLLSQELTTNVSSWYLTRIVSHDETDEIKLVYRSEEIRMRARNSENTPLLTANFTSNGGGATFNACTPNTVPTNRRIITHTYGWQLDSIITAHDIAVFEDSSRTDIVHANTQAIQGSKLKTIKLYRYGGSLDQQIQFFYEDVKSRMYLKRVQMVGYNNNTTINPYKFTYYQPSNFPDPVWKIEDDKDPVANQNGVDHWGYYNGQSQSSLVPTTTISYVAIANGTGQSTSNVNAVYAGADRNPDEAYVKTGILNRIEYPTGGYTDFTYEPHSFSKIAGLQKGNDTLPNGNYVYTNRQDTIYNQETFTISSQSLIETDLTLVSEITTDQITDIDTFTTVPTSLLGSSSVSGMSFPVRLYVDFDSFNPDSATVGDPNHYVGIQLRDITDPNNIQTILYLNPNIIIPTQVKASGCFVEYDTTIWVSLPAGKFELRTDLSFRYPNTCSTQVEYLIPKPRAFIQATFDKVIEERYLHGGGLRIKEIRSNDGNGSNPDIVKSYRYIPTQDTSRSSGVLANFPKYLFIFSSPQCYYVNAFSTSQTPLGTTSGNMISYSEVVETQSNGEIGTTRYHYNTAWEEPDIQTCSNPAFTAAFYNTGTPVNYELDPCELVYAPVTKMDWRRGDLLKTEVFDASNNLIQETTNTYTFSSDPGDPLASVSDTLHALYMHFLPETSGTIKGLFADYQCITGFKYVSQQTSKLYNDPSNPITQQSYTYYNNPNHLLPSQTVQVNSDGRILDQRLKYPQDYASGLTFANGSNISLDTLINRYLLSSVIETQTWEGTSASPKLVQSQVNLYTNERSGSGVSITRPFKVFTFQHDTPITSATLNEGTNGSGEYTNIIPNTTYFGERYELEYDGTYGNIIGEHKTEGTKQAYIWAYHQTKPIAQVVGAIPQDVAFTSFEGDILNVDQGNWSFSTPVIGSAKSGTHSYTGQMTSTISTAGTYIVSFWGSGTVSGGTNTLIHSRTVGSKTLYKYEIELSAGATVTVNGTNLDDVRLYPKGSQMTTYTYNELFQLISIADPSNQYSFFTYDALGRAVEIKDHNSDLRQRMQYHYINQPTN